MKRRDLLKAASLAIGSVVLPKSAPAADKPTKPNLVFIFADQLRADTLGCAGDKRAITPNIDKFAAQSVDFVNAVSVMPVCAAYRASLVTGKYPSSHGVVVNELNMNPNHRTIAHVLADCGYNLGYVGKWHLNDRHERPTPRGPQRMGFDGFWAAYGFNHRSYDSYYFTDGPDEKLQRVSLKGRHGPTEFTSVAIDYINKVASTHRISCLLSWG
jgi:arylsulfatase A-like enzyme